MEIAYRVCPRCAAEYLPAVERCLDCGVALVREGEAPVARAEDALALPAGEELVLVREAELEWARGLADTLAAAGIAHRIALPDPVRSRAGLALGTRYGVFVRPQDAPRAAALDADYARRELPDLGTGPAEVERALAADACPACGTSLAPDCGECPECGLVFAPGP